MKQSKKQQLKAKKHAAIFSDFCKMFKSGKGIDVIYDKLSNKYFLDQVTIYRIVINKRGIGENSHQVKGVP